MMLSCVLIFKCSLYLFNVYIHIFMNVTRKSILNQTYHN